MYKYKLSVIIPTYNTANELKRTIDVLLCQQVPYYEIIIIDDASTDETEDIVHNAICKYKHIKYIKNSKNNGAGFSRNVGLKCCSGEFITFLDSDDWVDLEAYSTAIDFLEKNEQFDIAIWGIKNEYNNSSSSHVRTEYNKYHTLNKSVALSLLCNHYSLDITISSYLGNKMFRHSLIELNNLYFENIIFEDVVFSFKSIVVSNKIVLLPNLYTHYYQRTKSIIHSFSEDYIIDMFRAMEYIAAFCKTRNEDYTKEYSSLIEKCSKTLLRFIYSNVDNPMLQKEYLSLFLNKLIDTYSIESIINYLDISRLKYIIDNL